jgi:hypothetical protein
MAQRKLSLQKKFKFLRNKCAILLVATSTQRIVVRYSWPVCQENLQLLLIKGYSIIAFLILEIGIAP